MPLVDKNCYLDFSIFSMASCGITEHNALKVDCGIDSDTHNRQSVHISIGRFLFRNHKHSPGMPGNLVTCKSAHVTAKDIQTNSG